MYVISIFIFVVSFHAQYFSFRNEKNKIDISFIRETFFEMNARVVEIF